MLKGLKCFPRVAHSHLYFPPQCSMSMKRSLAAPQEHPPPHSRLRGSLSRSLSTLARARGQANPLLQIESAWTGLFRANQVMALALALAVH